MTALPRGSVLSSRTLDKNPAILVLSLPGENERIPFPPHPEASRTPPLGGAVLITQDLKRMPLIRHCQKEQPSLWHELDGCLAKIRVDTD
jgi:hypothetical protein